MKTKKKIRPNRGRVYLTEKKLLEHGACAPGVDSFIEQAKGRPGVWVTIPMLNRYGQKTGLWSNVRWLVVKFQLTGVIRDCDGDTYYERGEVRADSDGCVYLSNGWVYFGCYDSKYTLDLCTSRKAPKSIPARIKLAKKLYAEAFGE